MKPDVLVELKSLRLHGMVGAWARTEDSVARTPGLIGVVWLSNRPVSAANHAGSP